MQDGPKDKLHIPGGYNTNLLVAYPRWLIVHTSTATTARSSVARGTHIRKVLESLRRTLLPAACHVVPVLPLRL